MQKLSPATISTAIIIFVQQKFPAMQYNILTANSISTIQYCTHRIESRTCTCDSRYMYIVIG